MRWRGIVVNVVVGSLRGVSGLLRRVRDARRIEGTVLGSACKRPLGIDVCGFLEVITTPIYRGRIHGGTTRERTGGVLDWGDAKLIILLDDLIDPWLACGCCRGRLHRRETTGSQRLWETMRVVQAVGGAGNGTEVRTALPTGEIKIIVSSHVRQFRFGHSRASFSIVESLYES